MSADLGRSLSVHRGTFASGGWFWYVGGVLILSGVVGLVKSASPPPGQSASDMVLTGVAGLIAGALFLLMPLARLRQTVEVLEQGFVLKRLLGERVVPRSEIAGIELLTIQRKMGSVTKVIVKLRTGGRLALAGLDNPQRLANSLRPSGMPVGPSNHGAPVVG